MQCIYVTCNVCNALAWDIFRMKPFLSYKLNVFIVFDLHNTILYLLDDDICDTFLSPTITLKKKNKTKATEYIWKLISFHNFSRKAFFVAYENDINTSATFSRRVYVPLHYQFIWYVHCTHIMYVFFVPFYILMYVFTYNISCFI